MIAEYELIDNNQYDLIIIIILLNGQLVKIK